MDQNTQQLLAAQAELAEAQKELAWEVAKTAVDVAGLVDPTPLSDLTGAAMSASDGDWKGAGLSLISVVPYIGDAVGKPLKGARAASKIAKLEKKVAALTHKVNTLSKPVKEAVDNVGKKAGKSADGAKCVEKCPTGHLRGKEVPLPGFKNIKLKYKKRDPQDTRRLRSEFGSSKRKQFLIQLAEDPKKLAQLKDAGLTKTDIAKIRNGEVPTGYQVHHKKPLDDGGDNSFDNLILIKNDPHHLVINNIQKEKTKHLKPGDSVTIDWPVVDGFVYPK